MSVTTMMLVPGEWPEGADDKKLPGNVVGKALFELVAHLPDSGEPRNTEPYARARVIAKSAALRAATVSGTLALPPGPLGMLTLVPDLVSIWKIQQQMVVDIAGAFGQGANLRREVMIYCLFKHGGAALVRDLVVRVGERVLVREATVRGIQLVLKKVGLKVTQAMVGRGVARWLPVVGAIGSGAYAFLDTKQVGATAADFFAQSADKSYEPRPS